ncbi:MAG: amidohydrolase [Acidobacteriales bacterium]|nr:amidohydrolase [Terriglobales bacterium]
MIVDAHVHIGKSTRLQINVDGEFLVRTADKLGFDKICVTDLTALFYDMHEGNYLLSQEMKKFPDRMLGYATISSTHFGQEALDELERCRNDYGMKGLKVYSTPDLSVAEPAMIPILEKCVELGFPILGHVTPQECEYMLTAVPAARIMMAHSGGQPFAKGDWNRAIMAAQRHPNLYLETASSTIDASFLPQAAAALGTGRIVFGTDTPLLDPYSQLARIRSSGLSSESLGQIMGANILRLMGVEQ